MEFFPLFISYKSQGVAIGLKAAFSAAMALLQPSYLQCIIEAPEAKGPDHNFWVVQEKVVREGGLGCCLHL